MFIHDFVTISEPASAVERGLIGGGSALLEPLAWAAELDLAAITEAPPRPSEARCTTRITIGPRREREDTLVIPLRWEDGFGASGGHSIEGELEIAPLTSRSTQVTLNATYSLYALRRGTRQEALRGHRAVQVAVRTFLMRLAVTLERAAAFTSGRPRPERTAAEAIAHSAAPAGDEPAPGHDVGSPT